MTVQASLWFKAFEDKFLAQLYLHASTMSSAIPISCSCSCSTISFSSSSGDNRLILVV